jgi:hypothetical protein
VRKRTTFTHPSSRSAPHFRERGCDVDRSQEALTAVVAFGILWPNPTAFAQSSPAPSSVLPTGGGQGPVDPSDSVMLLLDHQSGVFQTVKEIGVAELHGLWLTAGTQCRRARSAEPDFRASAQTLRPRSARPKRSQT